MILELHVASKVVLKQVSPDTTRYRICLVLGYCDRCQALRRVDDVPVWQPPVPPTRRRLSHGR